MDISYKIAKKVISFTQKKEDKLFSYVLTNQIGDSIIQSFDPEVCKSFGFFKRDFSKNSIIKIIDWFGVLGVTTKKVEVGEYTIKREFSSPYYENSQGTSEDIGYEKITISPNGGFIFETTTKGEIILDLDIRYFDDFSKFGKNYNIYTEKGVLFIEFEKVNDSNEEVLKQFIGIKTPNILFSTLEKWIEKKYWYDGSRGLNPNEFIFRALSISNNQDYKKIHVGYGFSKLEVEEQLMIMDNFKHIIDEVEKGIDEEGFGKSNTIIPISMQSQLAYDVAKRKMFDFVVPQNKDNKEKSILAGHPWFYQEWSRDEIFSLRAFLEIGETAIVKDKLFKLCELVNDNGELPRLFTNSSLNSIDASILLVKRIEDFVFFEEEHGRYLELYKSGIIHYFYEISLKIFNGIMSSKWDSNKELIRVEQGDWWRDTLHWIEYPLALQVGMINVISTLAIFSKLTGENSKCEEFLNFESHYREHVREEYYKDSILYDEPSSQVVTCDIFLAYYLYPDLCTQNEWEVIFDKALKHLYLNWGGISSLSKYDSRFKHTYSGANDESYHQGDSWYFMNAITAICLNHCNDKKFKETIKQIIQCLNEQVLFKGALGHIAEVSSANKAQTRGCVAQTWSLALYIELMHNIYQIKN